MRITTSYFSTEQPYQRLELTCDYFRGSMKSEEFETSDNYEITVGASEDEFLSAMITVTENSVSRVFQLSKICSITYRGGEILVIHDNNEETKIFIFQNEFASAIIESRREPNVTNDEEFKPENE